MGPKRATKAATKAAAKPEPGQIEEKPKPRRALGKRSKSP